MSPKFHTLSTTMFRIPGSLTHVLDERAEQNAPEPLAPLSPAKTVKFFEPLNGTLTRKSPSESSKNFFTVMTQIHEPGRNSHLVKEIRHGHERRRPSHAQGFRRKTASKNPATPAKNAPKKRSLNPNRRPPVKRIRPNERRENQRPALTKPLVVIVLPEGAKINQPAVLDPNEVHVNPLIQRSMTLSP